MDEAGFHDLISGKKTGIAAEILRAGLKGFSFCYGCAVGVRNLAFDRGLLRVHRAAVPVISVGNLTAGGTGKTPFVAWLAEWFRNRNVKVVLLSRGYRSLPEEVNDEKLVLDRLCPGVPHVQNPNRVGGARTACRDHGAQLLILDDGFQHRRLGRNLDIVLIDALNPWGYGSLLPRGLLREPLRSLRRADLIVISRADQCSADEKQQIRNRIQSFRGDTECVEVGFPLESLENADGHTAEPASFNGQPVCAFCGIGNPQAFRRSLEDAGFDLCRFRAFPDHHHYSSRDLDEIGCRAKETGTSAILVTQKDLVKINRVDLAGVPLWAVRSGLRVLEGEAVLAARLQAVIEAVL